MTGFESKRAMAQDKLDDEQLIDALIEQIKEDVKNQDFTAIEELLWEVPRSKLIAYLPEEKQ
jgi:HEAT repeat protein